MVKWVKNIETEIMVEIKSKSLGKAICEVLLMKFSYKKSDEKWPLCLNKQLFWWSASIRLDNYNGVLTES